MKQDQQYEFKGILERSSSIIHDDSPENLEPYLASDDLIRAVNLAIYLNRPLLLEGEPGCGKTKLAHAIAYELGLPFYPWYVRSTSKASEGLYSYDAILRLHDVHTINAGNHSQNQPDTNLLHVRNPSNPKDYRKFGPLGKAFMEHDVPSVVLIDEIDKADLDFPNDLLTVLDEPWRFEIPETNETITAAEKFKPIVIVTSNKEKGNLPLPFLRRCIYFYVDFPNDEERLKEIVKIHKEAKGTKVPEILSPALKRFLQLRNEGGLFKKPGTSELLDWLQALEYFGADNDDTLIEDINENLLHPSTLIKLRADWQKKINEWI